MRKLLCVLLLLAYPLPAHATYSIVARDPKTGELGVAVQSHWFAVGALVTWAEPGVGAVATQANIDPGYGPRALALLRAGKSAREALAELLAKDAEREVRQVALVDARGNVAAHTGKDTIPFAGHQTGTGFSVQANIMANEKVWPAMARAYRETKGPLAERLLAALDAAQAAGGDVRGKQSAAILIVGPDKVEEAWRGVRLNLRVDDAREPLTELRRLYKLARAYERANQGDALTAKKDLKAAATAYIDASKLAPENDELMFWAALSQAAAGKIDEAATQMMKVFDLHPGWRALLPYLRSSDSPGAPILQIRLGIPPKPRPGEGKRPPAAAPAPASPGAHEEKPPPPPAPPAAPAPPAPPPPQEPRTITSQQAAAMKISGVVPDYTEAARRANVTGEVLAKICVSESGTVTGVTLLKDLPQLGKHVQDTVRSWRYRPLQEGGRAVPFCHVTRFVFQLD